MAIVATPGAANANSFVTLSEANAYFAADAHPFGATWLAMTDPEKEATLIFATRLMCSFHCFRGSAVTSTQALCWPRSGLLTRNGFAIPTSGAASIPTDLKNATMELARVLTENRLDENEVAAQGITRLKVGSIELAFKEDIVHKVIPTEITTLMPGGHAAQDSNLLRKGEISWFCETASNFMFESL